MGVYGCICLSKMCCKIPPALVANNTYTVTNFTLVLEFKKGRLQNLYWKRDGCSKRSGNSKFVCLNNQDRAIRTSNCKNHGGSVDCGIGIQLAFSGMDKHLSVLNSWYEVENLRLYSLFGLYANLRDSLTSWNSKFFYLCFRCFVEFFYWYVVNRFPLYLNGYCLYIACYH